MGRSWYSVLPDLDVKVIKEFGRDLWIIVRKLLYQPNEFIRRNAAISCVLWQCGSVGCSV